MCNCWRCKRGISHSAVLNCEQTREEANYQEEQRKKLNQPEPKRHALSFPTPVPPNAVSTAMTPVPPVKPFHKDPNTMSPEVLEGYLGALGDSGNVNDKQRNIVWTQIHGILIANGYKAAADILMAQPEIMQSV